MRDGLSPEQWLQRWRSGGTGWHQPHVTPLLEAHWPGLGVPAGSRVLVPLCGKSLDMAWLAQQGYLVLGVELSPIAVQQFFEEQRLQPTVRQEADGLHHVVGNIEIVQGNVFDLDARVLAGCAAVYDRAALIALPAFERARYARQIHARLPQGSRGLLLTLEYPQEQMQGPPFSVQQQEVEHLFGAAFEIGLLARANAAGPQRAAEGTPFGSAAYRLLRR